MPKKYVKASAPSQAFLLGEHAVLYGSPALALSIDRRSSSTASELDKGNIRIKSDLGVYEEVNGKVVIDNEDLSKLSLGLKILLERYEIRQGVQLEIASEVPIGSGMASSASVAAAISKSIDGLFDLNLTDRELLEAVYAFERIIHGKASKTGPACAVFGGVIWIEWKGNSMEATSLGYREVPLVMACTGSPSPTKEMIDKVLSFKESFPEIHSFIVDSIRNVVILGKAAIEKEDLNELGRLMNINQGFLYSLGVSSEDIERIVWTARRKGAMGSKLSGAGGGGCVVSIHEDPSWLARELLTVSKTAFPSSVSIEGARLEGITYK